MVSLNIKLPEGRALCAALPFHAMLNGIGIGICIGIGIGVGVGVSVGIGIVGSDPFGHIALWWGPVCIAQCLR